MARGRGNNTAAKSSQEDDPTRINLEKNRLQTRATDIDSTEECKS